MTDAQVKTIRRHLEMYGSDATALNRAMASALEEIERLRLREILCEWERSQQTDVCEHGVSEGHYCEPCNREYKRALAQYE